MKRALAVIAGLVVITGAVGAGANWFLKKQVSDQITTALTAAAGMGIPIKVATVTVAPFGRGVTLTGLSTEIKTFHATIERLEILPRFEGPLGLVPSGMADIDFDHQTAVASGPGIARVNQPATIAGVSSTISIDHQTIDNLDLQALGQVIATLAALPRPKTMADLKALDWSSVTKLHFDHSHADHMTLVNDDGRGHMLETIEAGDADDLTNGVLRSESISNLAETLTQPGITTPQGITTTVTMHRIEADTITLPTNGQGLIQSLFNAFGITRFAMDGIRVDNSLLSQTAAGAPVAITIDKIAVNGIAHDHDSIVSSTLAVDHAVIPEAVIRNPGMTAVLDTLGLKTIDVSGSIHTEGDAAGQHSQFGPISIDGNGLAGLTVMAHAEGLGPLPQFDMASTPAEWAARWRGIGVQWAAGSFKDVTITLKDHGLLHELAFEKAHSIGQTLSAVSASLPAEINTALGPVLGTGNAATLGAALAAFIAGKPTLEIAATTEKPIPFQTLAKIKAVPLPDGALTITAKAD